MASLSFGLPSQVLAETSTDELAKQTLNPVAALYSLPIQYNWDWTCPYKTGHQLPVKLMLPPSA
jgi:hypothetical protein